MSSSKKCTSSHVSEMPPHLNAISAKAHSPVHLVKVAHRSARINAPIKCCEFGLDRVERLPGADFCHPCKLWDE
jgi:hypothetical protein